MRLAEILTRDDGATIAYHRRIGAAPGIVFLGGFRSDMTGTKALFLDDYCGRRGQAYVRFDYFGHGASEGDAASGTIGRWAEDALAVIDRASEGPLLLVGSSMGGWIALLAARARPGRVVGLVGIAAAPDFTEVLMWQAMTFEQRATLMSSGVLHVPSQYGDPYPITRALIEDGRNHLLLHEPVALDRPVRLLHGQRDPDVPWEFALRIADQVTSSDVRVILVKDGDHRLSRPQDLALLCQTLSPLLGEDGA